MCLLLDQALAYVMHKTPNVFPIIGGRKIEHLKANVEALRIQLSKEDLEAIEDAIPFDPGFPMNFLTRGQKWDVNGSLMNSTLMKNAAHVDALPRLQPIKPRADV